MKNRSIAAILTHFAVGGAIISCFWLLHRHVENITRPITAIEYGEGCEAFGIGFEDRAAFGRQELVEKAIQKLFIGAVQVTSPRLAWQIKFVDACLGSEMPTEEILKSLRVLKEDEDESLPD